MSSLPAVQFLISKYSDPMKETRTLEEMADSRTAEKADNEPEISFVSKGMKCSKMIGMSICNELT